MAQPRQPGQRGGIVVRQGHGARQRGWRPTRARQLGHPFQLQMALQRLQQFGLDHRLVDKSLRTCFHQLVGPVLKGIGRDHDDGHGGAATRVIRRRPGQGPLGLRPQAPRGLPAVHVVHRDVQQHRVRRVVAHALQAFAAAGRLTDLKTQRQQHAGQHLALGRVVVDHQQAAARAQITRHRPVVAQAALGRCGDLAQIQPHSEGTALPGRAGHGQLAAHQLGQQMGDGQAQAGAGVTAAPPGAAALEGHEDALQVLLGNADAGVYHLQARHLAAEVQPQNDVAVVGEAHRIAQQVEQDLAQPLGVSADVLGHPALGLQLKAQVLGRSLRRHHVHQIVQKLPHRQRRRVQPQPASLDARQIEQAIDQTVQVLAAAVDSGHRAARRVAQAAVLEQDLGITQDAVERGAQLMGDASDITRLGLVGGFSLVLGGLQRGVGAAVGNDLLRQQQVVTVRFVLGPVPAFAAQHDPPSAHGQRQRQQRKSLQKRPAQGRRVEAPQAAQAAQVDKARLLLIDHAQDHAQQGDQRDRHHQVMRYPEVDTAGQRQRQQRHQQLAHLVGAARFGLAAVVAT